jgi:pimeloyl-ACP methyl ester carboxylesterase
MTSKLAQTDAAAATQKAYRRRQRAKGIAITVLFGLPSLYVVICVLAALVLSSPGRNISNQTPASVGLQFEDVHFASRAGGVQIASWFIPKDASHRAIVLVHGKDASRTSEFGGRFLAFASGLHNRGFNLLMIDLRGHGSSGRSHLTFGINEKSDVEAAVDWLKSRGFTPASIGTLGVSLGGASSLMAAADDNDIAAVVSDSSCAEIYPVIQENWRSASGLPLFFLPGVRLAAKGLFGMDLAGARPVADITRISPRPVLLIHGTNDALVPIIHARQLKDAYPEAELWEVQGVVHAGAYAADPGAYVDRVARFFDAGLRQ